MPFAIAPERTWSKPAASSIHSGAQLAGKEAPCRRAMALRFGPRVRASATISFWKALFVASSMLGFVERVGGRNAAMRMASSDMGCGTLAVWVAREQARRDGD